MTNEELHKILDDKNKKLSIDEFKEIIYQLKHDCYSAATKISLSTEKKVQKKIRENFYLGEENAFHIALMLSDHLERGDK